MAGIRAFGSTLRDPDDDESFNLLIGDVQRLAQRSADLQSTADQLAADIAAVNAAITDAIAGLGTMAQQNANAVAITGGSISGITDLAIADGGTGASTAIAAHENILPMWGFHGFNTVASPTTISGNTDIVYGTTEFDVGTDFDGTSVTIPYDGYYHLIVSGVFISFNGSGGASPVTSDCFLSILTNGSLDSYYEAFTTAVSTNSSIPVARAMIGYWSSGDVIKTRVQISSANPTLSYYGDFSMLLARRA